MGTIHSSPLPDSHTSATQHRAILFTLRTSRSKNVAWSFQSSPILEERKGWFLPFSWNEPVWIQERGAFSFSFDQGNSRLSPGFTVEGNIGLRYHSAFDRFIAGWASCLIPDLQLLLDCPEGKTP